MTDQLGIACLVTCAILAGFVLLQLVSERRRRGIVAWVATFVALIVALAASDGDGIAWVTQAARRTDVIGLGITFTVAAATLGVLAGSASRTAWGQLTCIATGVLGIVGALAAVAVGRATAQWEFVALVTCGIAMTWVGATGARDRAASPDRRIVLGATAALGTFTAVGGTLLGIAWSSLA